MWWCEMENVMIWERIEEHHETDINSINLCQFISTQYEVIKL